MQISFLNGQFISKHDAKVSIEDRGFNFADGVYEVINFKDLVLLNFSKHLKRLKRSLSETKIKSPFINMNSLHLIIKNLIHLNSVNEGFIYIQITRGTSQRNHLFPKNALANIVISLYPHKNFDILKKGVKVKLSSDLRWKRCDIKTISLLPNVLGKQLAHELGVYELWLINSKKKITEGTTSNAFIILDNGKILTHPKNNFILGGVTRDSVIEVAKQNKLELEEKAFTLSQAFSAKEAFLTSTTVGVLPVLSIDDKIISKGKIGSVTQKLMKLYDDYLSKQINE